MTHRTMITATMMMGTLMMIIVMTMMSMTMMTTTITILLASVASTDHTMALVIMILSM